MPMIDDGKRASRAPEDLTLRLGPRIGQRLGEAGDREICRRGPSRKLSDVCLRCLRLISEKSLVTLRLDGSLNATTLRGWHNAQLILVTIYAVRTRAKSLRRPP